MELGKDDNRKRKLEIVYNELSGEDLLEQIKPFAQNEDVREHLRKNPLIAKKRYGEYTITWKGCSHPTIVRGDLDAVADYIGKKQFIIEPIEGKVSGIRIPQDQIKPLKRIIRRHNNYLMSNPPKESNYLSMPY